MSIPEQFSVLKDLPLGVCAVDSDFTVVLWNSQIENWTGTLPADILGKKLTEFYPHLNEYIYSERIKDTISHGIPQIFSSILGSSVIPVELSSGEKMGQRTSVIPYQSGPADGGRKYALILIEDISDLKKEVDAYRKMKDRAIMSLNEQIRAEKERFHANEEANLYLDVMAHDLNNYNHMILGYASLLESADEEVTRKYSKRILIAAERSSQIIHSVSAVRKVRAGDSVLVIASLDEAVASAIEHYSHIDISYTETGAKVIADSLLHEVFANIFGHSIKTGGININILVDVEDMGDHYLIHVDDNGPGLTPEEEESFLSLSSEDNGEYRLKSAGLSLYIVAKLLERYGSTPRIGQSSIGGQKGGLRISFSLKKA